MPPRHDLSLQNLLKNHSDKDREALQNIKKKTKIVPDVGSFLRTARLRPTSYSTLSTHYSSSGQAPMVQMGIQ